LYKIPAFLKTATCFESNDASILSALARSVTPIGPSARIVARIFQRVKLLTAVSSFCEGADSDFLDDVDVLIGYFRMKKNLRDAAIDIPDEKILLLKE
jgi:hypothetical protein